MALFSRLLPSRTVVALALLLVPTAGLFAQTANHSLKDLQQRLTSATGSIRIELLFELSRSQAVTPDERINYAREGFLLARQLNHKKLLVIGYHALGHSMMENSMDLIDSARFYIDKSYELATLWDFASERAQARLSQGRLSILSKQPLKALEIDEDAARLADLSGDSVMIAKAYQRLSSDYNAVGLDSTALQYAEQALLFVDRKNNEVLYTNVVYQIGNCHLTLKNYDKAINYYEQCSQLADKYELYRLRGYCKLGIASIHLDRNELKKCLDVTLENIAYARAHQQPNIEASALAFAAGVLRRTGQYDSAINCLTTANNFWASLKFNESPYYVDNMNAMGICYVAKGELDRAISILRESYRVGKKNHFYVGTRDALMTLNEAYIKQNNYRAANQNLVEVIQLNDSIRSQEHLTEMARLEYRFMLTKVAREKQLITSENDANKQLIEQKNALQIVLLSAIVILIIGILVIIRLFRQKSRANQELAISNTTIAQQKEELEAALENSLRMQQQLIHSEKMASLGQLTAGIAHEINNPLNFISGGAAALEGIHDDVLAALKNPQAINPERMAALAGEMKTIMNVIKNGVSRSTNIIKDLRTFSSPIDQVRQDSRTNLKSAVTSAIVLMNSKIQNASIKIETDLQDLIARANESLIQQVLVNLLDNAVHALETKGNDRRIWIKTETHSNRHHLCVRDNGPGIPLEHQARILEPFFTTKEVGKGTGLGLSISYGIIQKHGGNLTFTSEVGKGTEFIISLPAST